jgi:hypothetical protein
MFVRLRVQSFESSVNKEFQEKKLVNSKTMIYSPHLKGVSSAGTNLVSKNSASFCPFVSYEKHELL